LRLRGLAFDLDFDLVLLGDFETDFVRVGVPLLVRLGARLGVLLGVRVKVGSVVFVDVKL